MKVLVFGSNGQVGRELRALSWQQGIECIFLTREDVDLSDSARISEAITTRKPDWVVNASAYTAVDKAESEEELATLINAIAPEEMAKACHSLSIPFLTISTDYVFDGAKDKPYTENDAMCPVGAYGRSKVDGENRVRKVCEKHIIMRTAWVYSTHGGNFVKTMLRLGLERDELGVVKDQLGCPTAASSIAQAVKAIIETDHPVWGTYHFCDKGEASWFEFADYIFDLASAKWGKRPVVNAITTDQYPTPATRPANSRLDCAKIEQNFDLNRRIWQEEVIDVVHTLLD